VASDSQRLLELRDRLPVEWSGLLTRGAQALAAIQAERDDERRCRGCGSPLPTQERGRPREWCQATRCQRESKSGGKKAGKRTMRG
jgi:hypothetical protein